MAGVNNTSNGFPSNSSHSNQLNGSTSARHDVGHRDPDKTDLRRLFYLLWGNKWIISGFIVICVLLASVAAWMKTSVYESSGSMMITESSDQYSTAGSGLGNLLSNSYGIGLGSSVSDELQILRSRHLSQEVADTLLNIRMMENGSLFPILYSDYPDDSTLASQNTIASRLRQGLSYSKVDPNSNLIRVTYQSPSPIEAAKVVNLTINTYSQLSTEQNRKSANAAVDFLQNERNRIENRLRDAEDNLEQYMDQSELVQVDEQTRSLIRRTTELEQRRQEARTKLVAVNSAIERYQSQLNSIKPGLADYFTNAVGASLSRVQTLMARLQTDKMLLLNENPQLRKEGVSSPRLEELNRQIKDYKEEIRSLTEKLLSEGEQYLGYSGGDGEGVTQRMATLNERLIQLKVEQQQYESQVEVLTNKIEQLEGRFDQLPEKMTNLARLKRAVQINEELYLTVSKQYAEMSLWQQTQFGQGQLVDKGYVPGVPVEPNTKLYLLVGFLLGGILGVSYVFVGEAFNNRVDGAAKLREFDVPLLSVVPDITPYINEEHGGAETTTVQGREVSTTMVSITNPISPISESFRRLEANVNYANPDTRLNSLLVTSTRKGEGKSTVAANLGVVMAEADQKVIIVDTDLRRPNMYNMFRMERSPGIMEVLFDSAPMDEAIRETVIPNLHVLTTGNRPPNPPAVIKSTAFLALIKELEQRYDRVILDTSPFGIIMDSSSFIERIDGIVLVTRFNETKFGELEHTLHSLQRVNANVVGTVLNAFKADKSSDYYYGQDYYQELYREYEEYQKV